MIPVRSYDIAIIGAGVAGVFAAHRLAQTVKKDVSIALFDIGRPAQKRRVQMSGFAGLLPFSDGKLYLEDYNQIANISGKIKATSVQNYCTSLLETTSPEVKNLKISDRTPSANFLKKITKLGYEYHLNNHIQLYPKQIHALCRVLGQEFEKSKYIFSRFDTEIETFERTKNGFYFCSDHGEEFKAKKVILCVGRASWRWVAKIFDQLGVETDNTIGQFGARIEMEENVLIKDLNKSNLSIFNDKLSIGPVSWNGTVIPEDHMDMAISAYRSNEDRWKTDKVSFNVLGKKNFGKDAYQEVDRIGNLSFILTDERIRKEKISALMLKKSKVSIIPAYDYVMDLMTQVDQIFPELISKGYFHAPTLLPLAPKPTMTKDFSTNVPDLFAAGETAGVVGLWSAMLSGIIAADGIMK